MADFTEIYDLYADKVYHYLLGLSRDRHRAEELTQETFLKALQNIEQYEGRSSFYTWLCRIVKNLFLNEEKKRKRSVSWTGEGTEQEAIFPDYTLIDRETLLYIHKALHQLKEPYREVFSLKIFGELKYREIADIFGKTESWAKVTFFRAKERIVKEMEEKGWL